MAPNPLSISALGALRQLGPARSSLDPILARLAAAPAGGGPRPGPGGRLARQGQRNARDGAAFLKVAEGVLRELATLLQRAAGLAEQAQAGTVPEASRADQEREFQALLRGLAELGLGASFNGHPVFSAGRGLQLSAGIDAPFNVALGAIATSPKAALGLVQGVCSIATPAAAGAASPAIAAAQARVDALRATLGEAQDRLAALAGTCGLEVENHRAEAAGLPEVGAAAEAVQLIRFQILSRTGSPPPGEAQQAILALLR